MRDISNNDGRLRDLISKEPLVIRFAHALMHEPPWHGHRTVKEYAREVEVFGAFLERREPSALVIGASGKLIRVPYRGPFGDALLRARESDIKRYMLHLASVPRVASNNVRIECAINRTRCALRKFYNFLVREQLRFDDPTLKIANMKVCARPAKAMDVSILQTLASSQDSTPVPIRERKENWQTCRDRAMLELVYATGIRRGELIACNLTSIDFAKRLLAVPGRANQGRVVPFTESAEVALRAYIAVKPMTDDGALFVSQQRQRISTQQIGVVFRRYAELSGTGRRFTARSVRQACAFRLLRSGADLVTVKDILGYESLAALQQYLGPDVLSARRASVQTDD